MQPGHVCKESMIGLFQEENIFSGGEAVGLHDINLYAQV